MTTTITVVAHLHAAPGEESLFREVLEGLLAPTRAEAGCLRYDLFEDTAKPGRFTFIEEWASAQDLERHSRSAHIAAARARIDGRYADEPWIQALRRVP